MSKNPPLLQRTQQCASLPGAFFLLLLDQRWFFVVQRSFSLSLRVSGVVSGVVSDEVSGVVGVVSVMSVVSVVNGVVSVVSVIMIRFGG